MLNTYLIYLILCEVLTLLMHITGAFDGPGESRLEPCGDHSR